MNWYKKAQMKIPTMENIIWAIDKLIAENYDFSVEELQQAGQGSYQEPVAKAAQVKTKNKPRKGVSPKGESVPSNPPHPLGDNLPYNISSPLEYEVLELLNTGRNSREIGVELGVPTQEVSAILKRHFSYKSDIAQYLRKKHEKNILETTEDLSGEMRKTFNILSVKAEDIGEILGVYPKYVKKTLSDNKVNLNTLKAERRDRVESNIADIVKMFSSDFQLKDVINMFKELYGFKLTDSSAHAAMKLNNLGESNQNSPKTILQAFTNYINGYVKGGRKALAQDPELLSRQIDNFFRRYGKSHGFIPPLEQGELKQMLMTKIQLRDKTMDRAEVGNSANYYVPSKPTRDQILVMMNNGVSVSQIAQMTGEHPENIKNFYKAYQAKNEPISTDQSHPSYFLNNNQDGG